MAVTNKDFKIKYGLIVEGANATVNGNQVLTEVASDQYILNLIGGETLVKSVSDEFNVSVAGELSLDRSTVDAYYDAAGDAAAAQAAAIAAAALDATAKANDAYDNAVAEAAQDATEKADQALLDAKAYTNDRETAITTAYQDYADDAEADAISAAAADATTKANAAEAAAILAAATDATTKANAAQAAAEEYADDAVAALVNGAPELLDTLNELAAAIGDDENFATTVAGLVADKQDTLTAGSNIDITGATISVTGLDSGDISDFNSAALSATAAAYDAVGSAAAAQAAAEEYADGLAVNYDAAGSAADALQDAKDYADALDTDDVAEGLTNQYFTDSRAKDSAASLLTGANLTNITISGSGAGLTITAENGVADSTTDDLEEGDNNLYFTDERAIDAVSGEDIYPNAVIINNLTKHVASQLNVATAGIATGISWAKADYRSAEFVVKVAYGNHTEISKVLLTLDVNDNIAITEYGNVTTNGSASSISADISGTDARLRVTTVNNNSTVTVIGTLIQ